MPRKGQKITKEHSQAIADANRRRIFTPEMRGNYSKAQQGKTLSDEHKKKLSDSLSGDRNPFFGRTHSEETRRKISEGNKGKVGYNLGKHLSDKTKEKLRRVHLGKPSPMRGKRMSEESREKMRMAWGNRRMRMAEAKDIRKRQRMKDAWKSRKDKIGGNGVHPETREKLSISRMGTGNSFYGKKHSPETIEKMTGPNNSQWKGGHERYYGPEWTKTLRAKIRRRDGYKCMINPSHLISGHFGVPDVHHIIPYFDAIDAQLERPHRHENLISLCRKCHRRAEAHPNVSVPQLQSLLIERYSYQRENMLSMPIYIQTEKSTQSCPCPQM